MRGRTEESIKNSIECMHKIAEIAFSEELELIDSYIEDNPPATRNQSIWYLGKSVIDGGMREGLVFRSQDGTKSFKAVSNEFLLKYHQ